MKPYKWELLRKEFSFLDRIVSEVYDVSIEDLEVLVKRGDKNLLTNKGREDSYHWSGSGHTDYTKYVAVWADEGGDAQVKLLKTEGRAVTGSGDHEEWECDTVGEQLFALKIVPDFIVECERGGKDSHGNGSLWFRWTIYKMGGFHLVEYHMAQIDRAASELKVEIAATLAR